MDTYDVVVVGAGAAGLTAALVLGRGRRRVAVVDAGNPRNAPAAHMHGFLSRDGTPPAELVFLSHTFALPDEDRARLSARGVRVVDGEVTRLVTGPPDAALRGVELADGRCVPREAVFIPPRMKPHDELLISLGARRNAA